MIFYEVGGSVRDSLMGRRANDTDMTAVVEGSDWALYGLDERSTPPFELLLRDLNTRGFKVVTTKPEFVTAKAVAPSGFEFAGRLIKGAVDFVLARRDGPSLDRRHPNWVAPGSLSDDLRRRDFTVNAIARDSSGVLIDEHDGVRDIGNRVIRCVGAPLLKLTEDRLRILRALRFSVTHSMTIDSDVGRVINDLVMCGGKVFGGVSTERIQEELLKMFAEDTVKAVSVLTQYSLLPRLFTARLWLKPTTETK
jgi:tRNA nucleotidyltransferase/poly(A) polymerase